MNATAFGNTKKNHAHAFVFAILFWFVKRYNKTNKVVNIWPRSDKDLVAHGVTYEFRGCMSRDNRVHLRYGTWSIYIGKPQAIKPVVKA